MKSVVKTFIILALLVSNVGCDQISKQIARKEIDYNERIDLIGNFFTLTKIENTGAFLSVGESLPDPLKTILLNILPLVALTLAMIYLFTSKHLSQIKIVGISFFIGGGIGNIYDRIVYGSVTDFMHMDFGVFQTGIFNMADVSIMTGMLLILLESFGKRTQPHEDIAANAPENKEP